MASSDANARVLQKGWRASEASTVPKEGADGFAAVRPGAFILAQVRGSRRLKSRGVDTPRNEIVLLGVNSGGIMPDDMGSIRVDIEIENPAAGSLHSQFLGS
jgi:hypothetical protein